MNDDETRASAAQVIERLAETVQRGGVHPTMAARTLGELLAKALPELAPPRPATTSFAEASKRAMELIARRVSGDEAPIPLPFQDLTDQFGGGLWPGLHFVTSTTGTGKTALALQIARRAARNGSEVLYVPLELDAPQLAIRMISDTLWDEWRANGKPQGEAPPSWSDAYEGRMSTTTGTAAGHAAQFNEPWRARFESVVIDHFHVIEATPGSWDAMTLEAELDSVLKSGSVPKHPPLIVVDFLQLVGPLGGTNGGKQDARERIGLVAYHLRDLARRRGVAVLVISSTARTNYGQFYGEKSKDSAPRVRFNDGEPRTIDRGYLLEGSGKESGEVEYAADSVSALLRAPDGQSIFATVKGRSRGPSRPQWCALRFEGGRFVEGDASAVAASWNEAAKGAKGSATESATSNGAKGNAPISYADDEDV